MPDLKLEPLLAASSPKVLASALEPFLTGTSGAIELDDTRLQPPTCYWACYKRGHRCVTLKSFFAEHDYQHHAAKLAEYYPEQLGHPDHRKGGLVFIPELNGILWGFPFDPSMPELYRCYDGAWASKVLAPLAGGAVRPELKSYRPEIGVILSYRRESDGRLIAYGKCAPDESNGRIFVVMQRLWNSPGRRSGRLRVARPLAFRAEADLLLQAPVPGKPIGNHRNRAIFLALASSAGTALAALQETDVPFGESHQLDDSIGRIRHGLKELSLTAPGLYRSMRDLITQIEGRARGSTPEPLGPSHGDYKWDQFLEYRGRFSLIDFELFCQQSLPAMWATSAPIYRPPGRKTGAKQPRQKCCARHFYGRTAKLAVSRPTTPVSRSMKRRPWACAPSPTSGASAPTGSNARRS